MMLLVVTACACVAVLIAVAGALWVSLRRERVVTPFAEMMRHAQKPPHPRMDLAAGIAAGNFGASQQVRGAARRRGLTLDAEAEAAAEKIKSQPKRLDWLFYNENMGDLSDPDPRRAPAGGVRRPLGTVSLPESR